jgi:flagellar L-ring protein precursor FlgH
MNGSKSALQLLTILGIACFAGLNAGAEMLNSNNSSWCSTEKRYQPGDLVTVVISESAQAEQDASTALHKDTKLGFSTGGILGNIVPSASAGLSSANDGGGNLSRQGKMNAMIGAVVEEVLSNGSLKIKGEQEITFDSGQQLIRVEGIARPRDISSENEIYSYRLANARIEFNGKDALHEKTRTGFLSRFLEWLWIF